ncbi:MAG TPA: isopentenyl-diphosphate Delta-isomerase [Trebonia sp.]|nr:isopentenyl-diphosphate Delta-isomerase [Trebonia sp.]
MGSQVLPTAGTQIPATAGMQVPTTAGTHVATAGPQVPATGTRILPATGTRTLPTAGMQVPATAGAQIPATAGTRTLPTASTRPAAMIHSLMLQSGPLKGDSMESVVLLDEAGHAQGTRDKAAVHSAHTPLHLAFSCYVFNTSGQFLLTRRADTKRVFPGVWTNSCCGHPEPGEALSEAVRRRVRQELGISLPPVTLLLPRFRYRAEMNGVVENEICPVYAGLCDDVLLPDPAEVADVKWTEWGDFSERVRAGELQVSPWCALQVAELAALGPDPLRWAAASAQDLPPAARP